MSDSALPLRNPDLDDFYEAWDWLSEHPYFFYAGTQTDNDPGWRDALDIVVVKTNAAGRIDDDPDQNKFTRIWLEAGPWDPIAAGEELGRGADQNARWTGQRCHDMHLDVSAASFEHGICDMAKKVMEREGDYPLYNICSHCYRNRPAGPIDRDSEWFCSESCSQCGPTGLRTEPVEGSDLRRYVPPREYFDCDHWKDR